MFNPIQGNRTAIDLSLKKKILGILLALMTATAIMDYAIHRWVIYPNYAALELAQAKKDLDRCMEALKDEIGHLDAFTNDWSAWDDTYRFVTDPSHAYIASNLGQQTFIDNQLNLIAFYTPQGRQVWARTYDRSIGGPVPIRPFDTPFLSPEHPLLRRAEPDAPVRGIFSTNHGPMLIASRPILTSDRRGPARGSLIMGRLLDELVAAHLRDRTQVNHRIWSLKEADLAPEERKAIRHIEADGPVYSRTEKQKRYTYAVAPGIAGTPGLLLRTDLSRQITAKGFAVIHYAVVSDALVTIAILIVSFGLLQRTVTRPLSALTRCIVGIGAGEDPAPGCVGERNDEIGVLGREFERMVQRLRATHQGLQREIDEHRRSRRMLDTYHHKLRRLSSELLLAEEGERRRIAIALHDRIGQSLTVSKMRLDALATSLPESPETTHIREVGESLEETIADTRMLTFELSPPILYEFGLGAALEWLCEKFSGEHNLEIAFQSDIDDHPMEIHLRVMLFQATRELLFNIVKHARARQVRVSIAAKSSTLAIVIEDDGLGFEPARVIADGAGNMGFGLFSIRERLDDLDGALDIRSEKGKGTCVTISCPLSPTCRGAAGQSVISGSQPAARKTRADHRADATIASPITDGPLPGKRDERKSDDRSHSTGR